MPGAIGRVRVGQDSEQLGKRRRLLLLGGALERGTPVCPTWSSVSEEGEMRTPIEGPKVKGLALASASASAASSSFFLLLGEGMNRA